MLTWFHNVAVQFSNCVSSKKVALQCHDFFRTVQTYLSNAGKQAPGPWARQARRQDKRGDKLTLPNAIWRTEGQTRTEGRQTGKCDKDRRAERETGKKLAHKLSSQITPLEQRAREARDWVTRQGRQACMARGVWGWGLGLSWGWGLGPKISGNKTRNPRTNPGTLEPFRTLQPYLGNLQP